MTAISLDTGFPARPGSDRNAFLFFVGLVWIGVLSGFGTDSFDHVSTHGFDYPVIVHVHAVVFVSWLVLFTVQVALIRSHRIDLHKRLGMAGAALAVVMVGLGLATSLVVAAAGFASAHKTPEFLAVQFAGMIGFAGLTGAGLLLRGTPSAHKRLMLLGVIFISDAGFARFLNRIISAPLGHTLLARTIHLYGLSDLIILAFGAYDLATRRRLHPAYLAGLAWCLGLQAIAVTGLMSPAWKAVSLHLIGY